MAPKAINYNADSVIYFKGDTGDRVFILKEGKVSLNYSDLETGQTIRELIQTGEFFGVKSALGKYPREETAVVLTNSSVVSFSVPEFEALAMQNTRIIMKMLKVFSTQLRKMHKRVQNLLATEKQVSPETGLYGIGEYYFRKGLSQQAAYAFRRYLTYYPSGKFSEQAVKNLEAAERGGSRPPEPKPTPVTDSGEAFQRPERGREISDVAKEFYNAVSLYSQQRYAEALKEFRKIAERSGDEEYAAKSQYEIGRCLFATAQYDECMRHFTSLVQKYPKHPDLNDALFFIAQCYEQLSEPQRALGIYRKLLSLTTEDDAIHRKAKRAIALMEGPRA
jgi:CRP-like cAMP-binding protein